MEEKILQNKIALVTGATAGIGRAAAVALARAGAKVVASGRRQKEGEETVKLIQKAGGEAIFVKADVSKEEEVQALIQKTLSTYKRLDIAFNNAGVLGEEERLELSTREQYQRLFDINVLGVFLSMKYEIPALRKSGGGAIINTSSVAGLKAIPGAPLYVATKHAVNGLTKAVALEVAKEKIRINAVCPGAIETEMFTNFAGDESSERYKEFAALHPIGRIGKSEEVADLVVFLASPAASFILGQTICVDGGFSTT